MQPEIRDSLVGSVVLAATPNPQQVCYAAMHQDYSADPVYLDTLPSEQRAGEIVVDRCLKFGHWGVIEHPQITINSFYYPHSVISQARTHRVGISFDVQSFRYTGKHLLGIKSTDDLEKVIYFRPVGDYTDRQGKKYSYTENERNEDIIHAWTQVTRYQYKYNLGYSEEHARSGIPYDYRQHFVWSVNLRSALHFLSLRGKKNAQLEIRWLAEDLAHIISDWCPQIWEWYSTKHKGHLAP
jgi:thymidylate synthase (FAD)